MHSGELLFGLSTEEVLIKAAKDDLMEFVHRRECELMRFLVVLQISTDWSERRGLAWAGSVG